MTEQAGASAPGFAALRWRWAALGATAGAAIALLGFGGCAATLPDGVVVVQPAATAPEPVASAPAMTAVPRPIAVLPLSKPARREREPSTADRHEPSPSAPMVAAAAYLWPVQGPIARAFGAEPSGRRSDGLDITAPEGAPVLAAEAGIVAYAGSEIQAYGNMLLIEHADGFTTVYAYNRDLLVRAGDRVRRGEVVATVGRSGGMAEPRLHFQLRAGDVPLDPTPYLVASTTVMASVDLGAPPGLGGE